MEKPSSCTDERRRDAQSCSSSMALNCLCLFPSFIHPHIDGFIGFTSVSAPVGTSIICIILWHLAVNGTDNVFASPQKVQDKELLEIDTSYVNRSLFIASISFMNYC